MHNSVHVVALVAFNIRHPGATLTCCFSFLDFVWWQLPSPFTHNTLLTRFVHVESKLVANPYKLDELTGRWYSGNSNTNTTHDRSRGDQRRVYSCNRLLCTYENPPQVAHGTFRCGASKCTGTFAVTLSEASSYHQTLLNNTSAGNDVRDKGRDIKWDTAQYLAGAKVAHNQFVKEKVVYEKILNGDEDFNYSTASYEVQLAAGQTVEEAKASLQRQLRAMSIRLKEVNGEIKGLDRHLHRGMQVLVEACQYFSFDVLCPLYSILADVSAPPALDVHLSATAPPRWQRMTHRGISSGRQWGSWLPYLGRALSTSQLSSWTDLRPPSTTNDAWRPDLTEKGPEYAI